jgi:Ca2+-binding EF-hand superfamily protein
MTDTFLAGERTKEFKEMFELFDVDKDGKLTRKELNSILKSLGQNIIEVNHEDEDEELNSTYYTFNDFSVLMNNRSTEYDVENELFSVFFKFDTEKTGFISRTNFTKIMEIIGSRFSEEENKELLIELDPENTGKIKLSTLMSKMGPKLFL